MKILILRYVTCMRHHRLLLPLLLTVTGSAWADSGQSSQGSATAALELRRTQLREALKRPVERVPAVKAQAAESEIEQHRLSAEERANLRLQLRQQRAPEVAERR